MHIRLLQIFDQYTRQVHLHMFLTGNISRLGQEGCETRPRRKDASRSRRFKGRVLFIPHAHLHPSHSRGARRSRPDYSAEF